MKIKSKLNDIIINREPTLLDRLPTFEGIRVRANKRAPETADMLMPIGGLEDTKYLNLGKATDENILKVKRKEEAFKRLTKELL